MTVHAARTAGFCAGVAKAVNTVRREMQTHKLVTYGQLIHNRSVTDELAANGVRIIHSPDEVQGETVVIRSHGIPPSEEAELIRRGIPYMDCTCPDVKKIHYHAARARDEGRTLIVLGEASHPEVTGYAGYMGGDVLFADDADELLQRLDASHAYTLVAQTTFERARFQRITEVLRAARPDIEIHDTVCDATGRRQAEAEALAQQMDVMIVLGDTRSANTFRLYEICKKHCERTWLLASISELQLQFLQANDKIGITAGASTPPATTKEAIQFMSDIANGFAQQTDISEPVNSENAADTREETPVSSNVPESDSASEEAAPDTQRETVAKPAQAAQSFEDMLNESFISLHTGDIVKATVISVTSSEVTVNLGFKSDGVITRTEMTDDTSADITQLAKPGDVFDVYVLRVNDSDGNVQVSKKKLDNQTNYKMIEQAFIDKAPIAGKVADVVKGGLIAMIQSCRVFVPSSQISNRYVEDLTVFKGKEFNFNILEFDRSKRRIVAGRKELAALEQQQRREELYSTLEIGQRMEGTVSRIVDFGAFIDLGGVDGLVHISELAWRRVRKVTDVLQVGDHVAVTVIDVNPEKNKISLSLKDVHNNPWNGVPDRYPIGSIVEGKVVRMASFGAFVMLEDGVDGLVHISQIADRHIAKPEDELSVGQMIHVKITDIDEANHKISLSKREADADMNYDEDEAYADMDDESEMYDESEEFTEADNEDMPASDE